MSDIKRMLSSIIRENGNYVSRDKAAESLRELTELEAQLKEANEVIGDWLKFEAYSIKRNGEYVEKEINALINSAREYLERHKIAE